MIGTINSEVVHEVRFQQEKKEGETHCEKVTYLERASSKERWKNVCTFLCWGSL